MYNGFMGKLERENKKEIRATKIQTVVLRTVATAGVLGVTLLLPNVLSMLKVFSLDKKLKNNLRRSINNSRGRLIKKGLLKFSEEGFLVLTSLGEKALRRVELLDYRLEKPKKWDGKWRMLIFDIKETKKGLRDRIRQSLISIGFVKLQNSVWVYPYDCEDFITLLKADLAMGKEVLYIIADKIENEKVLLKTFEL